MDWTSKLELAYRVCARQHTDTSLMFDQMRDTLKNKFGSEVNFSEVKETFWKCSAEDIEKARDRGLLLMELGTEDPSLYLVVRDLPITIRLETPSDEGLMALADKILEDLGQVFASVRIITEASTELQAI